ncbi:MAG: substrate binding domain-containing protein, partial [Pigmentiphaga sp.]
ALVARHLTTFYNGLYASPAYLARHGMPTTPADLLEHIGLVLVTSGGDHQHWLLSRGEEKWEGLPTRMLAANSMGLHQALAEQGLGIVGLSDQFANTLVKEKALQRILPDWSLPPTPVWCVTPGRRLLPQRTLAFIDKLKAVLKE